MKALFVTLTLIGSIAHASQFSLTPACEAQLKEYALQSEQAYLASNGQTLASTLEAVVYFTHWPTKNEVSLSVQVSDPVDGRSVRYSSKVSKTDAMACKVQLKRLNQTACRYSSEEGPDGLNAIPGMRFQDLQRVLTPDTDLTKLEEARIHASWGSSDGHRGMTTREIIESTDDSEITLGQAILPNGQIYDYMGAYGGDNPYGFFFKAGTTEIVGSNGDGSICLM